MTTVKTRGNTISLSFSFTDADGNAADVASAECELEYPGRDCRETETLTLTDNEDGTWVATWDSSKSRKGWVDYHAHAIADDGTDLADDGRFKLAANRANYQHDELPKRTTNDYDEVWV